MLVYLDSSAIVKRYIEEKGSDVIDVVYTSIEDGNNRAAFSIWNVGEVIGAIDTRQQKGDIDEKSMGESIRLFVGETKKFVAMRRLIILPITGRLLEQCRELIVKRHIYQADALQLVTASYSGSMLVITADKRLAECAKVEGIEVANPEKDTQKIIAALGGV